MKKMKKIFISLILVFSFSSTYGQTVVGTLDYKSASCYNSLPYQVVISLYEEDNTTLVDVLTANYLGSLTPTGITTLNSKITWDGVLVNNGTVRYTFESEGNTRIVRSTVNDYCNGNTSYVILSSTSSTVFPFTSSKDYCRDTVTMATPHGFDLTTDNIIPIHYTGTSYVHADYSEQDTTAWEGFVVEVLSPTKFIKAICGWYDLNPAHTLMDSKYYYLQAGGTEAITSDPNIHGSLGHVENNRFYIDGDRTQFKLNTQSITIVDFAKKEIWLKIGQSNAVGAGGGAIDHLGLDIPHPKVFEYSRGVDKSGFYIAAPIGELMTYRQPAQDGFAGVGFGQWFGKRRSQLNPDIEQIIIINRAVGSSGFSDNRWNPGNDLYTLAVNDLKQSLVNNPNAIFKGILWHQGENDAGQTQVFYQNALAAMVEGIRDEARSVAPGRVEGLFICGTMLASWIASTPSVAPIDLAHRNVASYITNATFADFSDLTNSADAQHFGTADLREMGRRYAQEIQDLATTIVPSYRVKVRNGDVVDLFNGGAKVFNVTTTINNERGEVMDSNGSGFQTSMVLNNTEYTKSGWVNLQTAFTGFDHFISGTLTGGTANAHYWGSTGSGQNNTTTTTPTGLNAHLTINNWVHVTLTWDGTQHQLFVNGVSVATAPVAATLTSPQIIELFNFNEIDGMDALGDDIVILPYALNATGVSNLYSLVQNANP